MHACAVCICVYAYVCVCVCVHVNSCVVYGIRVVIGSKELLIDR